MPIRYSQERFWAGKSIPYISAKPAADAVSSCGHKDKSDARSMTNITERSCARQEERLRVNSGKWLGCFPPIRKRIEDSDSGDYHRFMVITRTIFLKKHVRG